MWELGTGKDSDDNNDRRELFLSTRREGERNESWDGAAMIMYESQSSSSSGTRSSSAGDGRRGSLGTQSGGRIWVEGQAARPHPGRPFPKRTQAARHRARALPVQPPPSCARLDAPRVELARSAAGRDGAQRAPRYLFAHVVVDRPRRLTTCAGTGRMSCSDLRGQLALPIPFLVRSGMLSIGSRHRRRPPALCALACWAICFAAEAFGEAEKRLRTS